MPHTIFIVAPATTGQPDATAPQLPAYLAGAGYAVKEDSLDGPSSECITTLLTSFDARPPDIMIVNASTRPDLILLRHALTLAKGAWGAELAPPSLALLNDQQLIDNTWLSLAEDFAPADASMVEIDARIRLMLFRQRSIATHERLALADVTIDVDAGQAYSTGGDPLPLTPKEYELLRFLAEHRGKFFSRDNLLSHVWGIDYHGGERTVDIHVRRLRAKLPPLAAELLETRRGIGYGLGAAH